MLTLSAAHPICVVEHSAMWHSRRSICSYLRRLFSQAKVAGTGTSASALPLAVALLGDLELVPSPKGCARRCPSSPSSSGRLFAAPWHPPNEVRLIGSCGATWLETSDAEGEPDGGSGETAERAAEEEEPMVVARPSPTEAGGFDYESDDWRKP